MAFVPPPQELRAKHIGHVLLDTTHDQPWAQYFCCSVHANREFVTKHPIAAKRALRAILKSADLCAQDPKRAADYMVAKGYESNDPPAEPGALICEPLKAAKRGR